MAMVETRFGIGERSEARTASARGLSSVHPGLWVLGVALLLMPLVASNFVLTEVLGWTFIYGMIALSLMFLGGYGGMVSLAQMSVAACAGYMIAIVGVSAVDAISLKWPWWASVPIAIAIAVLFGTIAGALSVRTEGIYTIMITLAIASAFYYFTLQNYAIFNGFSGFNAVHMPQMWGVNWREPVLFYYVLLFWAALSFAAVTYVSRSPFGLALQGTRDNARRMAALGFNVTAHRIAAYAFAALIAAIAGVMLVWQQAQISPGTAGVGPVVDVLIMAVIGGMKRPIGPFIGALIYVLLRTFSLDVLEAVGLDGKRFQLLIGLVFLAIVLFSPDGVLGLWEKLKGRLGRERRDLRPGGGA
jgi:branched-chain amino acid transport system permease protein